MEQEWNRVGKDGAEAGQEVGGMVPGEGKNWQQQSKSISEGLPGSGLPAQINASLYRRYSELTHYGCWSLPRALNLRLPENIT